MCKLRGWYCDNKVVILLFADLSGHIIAKAYVLTTEELKKAH
jgi:hypothetical protein